MNGDKVGVLTFHRCFNYGSYWQARCLVEALADLGYPAELLDHDSPWVDRAETRCLMQPTLPLHAPRSDFPAYKRKGRKFIAAVDRLPRSRRFPVDSPELAPHYGRVVIGSDEVWNFQHPWYAGKRLFFGGELPVDRLIAYAASFGNHDAGAGIDAEWSSLLRGFDAIAVRDANARALVEVAVGRQPELVLDPVLLHPTPVLATAPADGDGEYVLVYGHGFPSWFGERVRRWSRRRELRLVSVGYRNDFADEQRLDAGPEEFAALMSGAAAVVTNFFHGCVFALANGRPWVSTPSAYRFNKIRDLATKLGAEDHIVCEGDDVEAFDTLLAMPIAPAILERIARLREHSRGYLESALS